MMETLGQATFLRTADNDDWQALHEGLSRFNRQRLTASTDAWDWQRRLAHEHEMRLIEGRFIERERREVFTLTAKVPSDPEGFVAWFESLEAEGPGQGDPLFPWLAERASYDEMRWFLSQEVAGEAGFEDLVALTQVKLPARPKLELARNYWDEMGQGHRSGMHGPMLERLAQAFALEPRIERTVWQSLALGNLMVGLATSRRYGYQSLGALGIIEQTAPARAEHVNEGLKRLGVAGEARQYFALHATLDVRHSAAWNREVLRPLVEADPGCARFIAEGAVMRLSAGARCFDRYRQEFGWSSGAFLVAPGS